MNTGIKIVLTGFIVMWLSSWGIHTIKKYPGYLPAFVLLTLFYGSGASIIIGMLWWVWA